MTSWPHENLFIWSSFDFKIFRHNCIETFHTEFVPENIVVAIFNLFVIAEEASKKKWNFFDKKNIFYSSELEIGSVKSTVGI